MNLFKRARTAPELVLKCIGAYEELARNSACQAALDHIVKYVGEMKIILLGDEAGLVAHQAAVPKSLVRLSQSQAGRAGAAIEALGQASVVRHATTQGGAALQRGHWRCSQQREEVAAKHPLPEEPNCQ